VTYPVNSDGNDLADEDDEGWGKRFEDGVEEKQEDPLVKSCLSVLRLYSIKERHVEIFIKTATFFAYYFDKYMIIIKIHNNSLR
jgi:hypothetical protein